MWRVREHVPWRSVALAQAIVHSSQRTENHPALNFNFGPWRMPYNRIEFPIFIGYRKRFVSACDVRVPPIVDGKSGSCIRSTHTMHGMQKYTSAYNKDGTSNAIRSLALFPLAFELRKRFIKHAYHLNSAPFTIMKLVLRRVPTFVCLAWSTALLSRCNQKENGNLFTGGCLARLP